MNRLNKKKLITVFFNVLLTLFYTSIVFAGAEGAGATTVVVPTEVQETLTSLTSILLLIGTAVCIGKVIHIGILYVTSTAAEKVNAKQAILPWIIGTFVCFGAATIGSAIIKIISGALPEGGVLDY